MTPEQEITPGMYDEDPEELLNDEESSRVGYTVKEKVKIANTNLGESFLKGIGILPARKGKLFVEHCPFCKVEVMKPSQACSRQYFHNQRLYAEKMKELNA